MEQALFILEVKRNIFAFMELIHCQGEQGKGIKDILQNLK